MGKFFNSDLEKTMLCIFISENWYNFDRRSLSGLGERFTSKNEVCYYLGLDARDYTRDDLKDLNYEASEIQRDMFSECRNCSDDEVDNMFEGILSMYSKKRILKLWSDTHIICKNESDCEAGEFYYKIKDVIAAA